MINTIDNNTVWCIVHITQRVLIDKGLCSIDRAKGCFLS